MKRSGSFTLGILIILFGGWLLAVQLIPSLEEWVNDVVEWPFWIIGPGLFFILAAIVSGVSGLAVPGMIISGVGGILYYQDTTGDYQSWAYLWTLIIGFSGIGVFSKSFTTAFSNSVGSPSTLALNDPASSSS